VRELLHDEWKSAVKDVRIQAKALACLQDAAEDMLVTLVSLVVKTKLSDVVLRGDQSDCK
jgi:histone H3/H4